MLKYIRHKHAGFVIFEDTAGSHTEMMQRMGWAKEELHSAGTVIFNTLVAEGNLDGLYCGGGSMILRVNSVHEDTNDLHVILKSAG